MEPAEHKDRGDRDGEPRDRAVEGLFDAQLTFSAPFVEGPAPVKDIVKRDGRTEAFDKAKITETIFKAAASIGGNDRERASNLASAIALYLSKKLDGRAPTVDQVGDAVEKVLVEMGHARTAIAYARYRDRRARIRRLRQGDTDVILNELAEARKTTGGLDDGECEPGVFVRTGGEQLRAWDRAKIAEALVRETGLDEGTAQVIALEVEQQIKAANVQTLTTGLVRELVNAKLIERGLETHWRRHVRLGVPLYDAKRIICGIDNAGGVTVDPERTSRVLAHSVKREYAVSQVFSAQVGDAHMRGDIYLHDLGRIDSLDSASVSVASIAKYGVGLPDSRAFSRPPKYADTLLAQMVNSSGVLQRYFSGAITWDALNIHFAPFLESCDEKALRQLAQMLIYEYAYRAAVQGDSAPETAIGLHWDAPPYLKDLEAVGAGGQPTGKTYGDYGRSAQQFLWALLDVLQEGGVQGVKFASPSPKIHIAPDFFRSPGHERFLEHAGEVTALRGNVLFALERSAEPASATPWDIRDVTAHRVTLNLPRLAYKSRGANDFFGELAAAFEIAAWAHDQKAGFVRKLMALESLGPLGLLAARRDGRPTVDMDRATYAVGICGLAECVQAATGARVAESEQAVGFAVEVVSRIAGLCADWSERLGLQLMPVQTVDARVAQRFAASDLDAWRPQTTQVLDGSHTQQPAYAPGVSLAGAPDLSPMERVRIEGRLQCFLDGDAATVVQMPDTETSPKSVADFIRKAYHQTGARRILIEAVAT